MLGSQYVARAEPDGYTFLLGSISNVLHNFFYKEPLYDLRKDLAPVSQVTSVPNYLAVGTKVPAHAPADMIELARRKPTSMTFSTSGVGSSASLSESQIGR